MKPRLLAAILALVLLLTASPGWTLSSYVVTDLTTLGGSSSGATGLNNSGQVVGWSLNASGASQAFSWTSGGGIQGLSTLPGYSDSEALGINGSGQIVGRSFSGAVNRPVLWSGGGVQNLVGLTGLNCYATDINDSGTVVGSSFSIDKAWSWTSGGGVHDLGGIPGTSSVRAYDINNGGAVAGSSGARPALLNGTWQGLGSLGGNGGYARGINDAGQVAGYANTASGQQHAFLWDGAMHDLGVLGSTSSRAYAINSLGMVVGESNVGEISHAFLWTEADGMIDLNLLLGECGWVLRRASDINDLGWIVGQGYDPQGQERAFLLSLWSPDDNRNPVPEPATMLLVGVGLAGLGGLKRRQR